MHVDVDVVVPGPRLAYSGIECLSRDLEQRPSTSNGQSCVLDELTD